jgi:hypothetical protein
MHVGKSLRNQRGGDSRSQVANIAVARGLGRLAGNLGSNKTIMHLFSADQEIYFDCPRFVSTMAEEATIYPAVSEPFFAQILVLNRFRQERLSFGEKRLGNG